MLVTKANMEDPDQTASKSDLGLPCLSMSFCEVVLICLGPPKKSLVSRYPTDPNTFFMPNGRIKSIFRHF